MKVTYLLALAALVVFALAGSVASADQYYYPNTQAPRMVQPVPVASQPAYAGAGPCTFCPTTNQITTPVDCCTIVPTGTCGAFCAGGQNAPGWPYNWCSEYWLRPNSNF